MSVEPPASLKQSAFKAPADLTFPHRSKIFLYLGFLTVLLNLAARAGGVIDIPVSFFLKNKLHLEAHEAANFRLIIAPIPLFFSFVSGFIRDTWHPFNIQDRGVMAVFGAVSAGLCLVFAILPVTYTTLLLAIFRSLRFDKSF